MAGVLVTRSSEPAALASANSTSPNMPPFASLVKPRSSPFDPDQRNRDTDSIPAGTESVSRLRWSGSKGLLRGFTRDANGGMFGDVLFADASAAGSLLRVTNTPAISETVP